jgi:hypothetical protein
LGWRDAEEDIHPRLCRVEIGAKTFKTSIVLATQDTRGLRKSNFVDSKFRVIELHQQSFCYQVLVTWYLCTKQNTFKMNRIWRTIIWKLLGNNRFKIVKLGLQRLQVKHGRWSYGVAYLGHSNRPRCVSHPFRDQTQLDQLNQKQIGREFLLCFKYTKALVRISCPTKSITFPKKRGGSATVSKGEWDEHVHTVSWSRSNQAKLFVLQY